MFTSNFIGREPITKSTLKEIATFIQEGENITTLWLPGGGRTNFGMSLQNYNLFNFIYSFFLRRKLARTMFIYVDADLNSYQIRQNLNETLSRYSESEGITNKINDITYSGYTIYFIIDNVQLSNLEVINYLLSFRSIDLERVKYIHLVLVSDFYSIKASDKRLTEAFFHNCVYVPHLTRDESMEWLSIQAQYHRIRINNDSKESLYDYSGGNPVLLGHALRCFKNYKHTEKCFNSIEMQSLVHSMWHKFSSKEKQILTALITTKTLPLVYPEVEYLQLLGLIADDCTTVNGKWMESLLYKEQPTFEHNEEYDFTYSHLNNLTTKR